MLGFMVSVRNLLEIGEGWSLELGEGLDVLVGGQVLGGRMSYTLLMSDLTCSDQVMFVVDR